MCVGPGEGSRFPCVATDMSLRPFALSAKCTCAKILCVGVLRCTTSMRITADITFFCKLFFFYVVLYCMCVLSIACNDKT